MSTKKNKFDSTTNTFNRVHNRTVHSRTVHRVHSRTVHSITVHRVHSRTVHSRTVCPNFNFTHKSTIV